MRRLRSLATGITVVSVLVALIAIAVIVVGVLVVAQSTFDRLMIQAGTPAAEAQTMFDHGVEAIFLVAVLIAIAISVGLAVVLAARLASPLQRMAWAAERIARGDYEARVPRGGPAELASLTEWPHARRWISRRLCDPRTSSPARRSKRRTSRSSSSSPTGSSRARSRMASRRCLPTCCTTHRVTRRVAAAPRFARRTCTRKF